MWITKHALFCFHSASSHLYQSGPLLKLRLLNLGPVDSSCVMATTFFETCLQMTFSLSY